MAGARLLARARGVDPALAMAYLALIKARMLEFCPEVLGGDVILPRASGRRTACRLLLPLQFTNAGYAGGIIEWIALRLTVDGRHRPARCCSARSPRSTCSASSRRKRQLETRTPSSPSPASPSTASARSAKFVLFEHAEQRAAASRSQLRPGRYSFELFIKATQSRAAAARALLRARARAEAASRSTAPTRPSTSSTTRSRLPGVRRALAGAGVAAARAAGELARLADQPAPEARALGVLLHRVEVLLVQRELLGRRALHDQLGDVEDQRRGRRGRRAPAPRAPSSGSPGRASSRGSTRRAAARRAARRAACGCELSTK